MYVCHRHEKCDAEKRLWQIIFVLFFVLLFFFHANSLDARQNASEANNDQYVFGPGDILDVSVFGEPEVSSSVIVRIDGRISLPLAGEFMAAGVTPETLTEKIRLSLERFIESPEVTVMLADSRSKRYYVLGQIASPGEYGIIQPVTLIQAIARAGGFLEWANKRRIMIVGGPGTEEKITYFNYNDFLNNADSKQNVIIQPGDTIVVP